MRIIRGKYGRRRFDVPKTFKARPTTDMAKENLFNILENRVVWEETRALDLFAGTGSIGLEMVSRGCPEVVAVEQDREHCQFIRGVLRKLGEDAYQLHCTDALRFISCGVRGQRPFDLIFADPPYTLAALEYIPDQLLSSGLLHADGLFVLEHPRDYSFEDHLAFQEVRNYGSVHFSFFAYPITNEQ